jgi:hypothetical protein
VHLDLEPHAALGGADELAGNMLKNQLRIR